MRSWSKTWLQKRQNPTLHVFTMDLETGNMVLSLVVAMRTCDLGFRTVGCSILLNTCLEVWGIYECISCCHGFLYLTKLKVTWDLGLLTSLWSKLAISTPKDPQGIFMDSVVLLKCYIVMQYKVGLLPSPSNSDPQDGHTFWEFWSQPSLFTVGLGQSGNLPE